jgi:hypothetical protein
MNSTNQPAPARSFSTGFAWLTAAAVLLRSQAPRLLLIGLLFQLLGGASQVGILALFFIIAVPALTAGMLQALHLAAVGERPGVITLFAAFQGGGKLLSLFILGLLTILATVLVLGILVAGALTGLDPELAARIQAGDQAAVLELDPALVRKVLFGMLLGLLVGACLGFFAIPLIWFQGRSLGDALWTGLVVLFRQWRALTALGIGLAAIGLPVGLMAGMLMAAQASGAAPSLLLTVILMLVVVLYQVLAFAAQYIAFRDVFMEGGLAGETGPEASSDDQLVA